MLRDAEAFLPDCSWFRRDFVGEREVDLLAEGRCEEDLFSLISRSDFFLGEDLVKRP